MDRSEPANPGEVFHAVGYTKRDILEGGLLRLLDLPIFVQMENERLLWKVGPLLRAMSSGKVICESVEALFVATPLSEVEIPYPGRRNEPFLCIEYLNETALRLSREYGIDLPPVLGMLKRGEIPRSHAATVDTVHYRRI